MIPRRFPFRDAAQVLGSNVQDLLDFYLSGSIVGQVRVGAEWRDVQKERLAEALARNDHPYGGMLNQKFSLAASWKEPLFAICHIHFTDTEVDRVKQGSKPKLDTPGQPIQKSASQELQGGAALDLPNIDFPGRMVVFRGTSFEVSEPQLKCIEVLRKRCEDYLGGRVQSPDMHQKEILKAAGEPETSSRLDQLFRRRPDCFHAVISSTGAGKFKINTEGPPKIAR